MKSFFIIFFSCLFSVNLYAQITDSLSSDTIQIKIIYSDALEGVQQDTTVSRKLTGNVQLEQDSIIFYGDTAELKNNFLNAWGNILIQQNDTLFVFADSLAYNGNDSEGHLYDSVVVKNGSATLFSDQITYNTITQLASYHHRSLVEYDSTQIHSNRGYYYTQTGDIRLADDVVVVNNNVELRADTLLANANTQIVTFLGPTKIWKDSAIIYCESGYYDFKNDYAVFDTNPQFIRNNRKSIAKQMIYDGKQQTTFLIGEAKYSDEEQYAEADTIKFLNSSSTISLLGNAKYVNDNQLVTGPQINYNTESEAIQTKGKTTLNYDKNILTANLIESIEGTETYLASGKVSVFNPEENVTLICDSLYYNQTNEHIETLGARPYIKKIMDDGDSLFLAADTFRIQKIITEVNDSLPNDTIQMMTGFYQVAFFNSQMSGLADSMTFIDIDSALQLHGNPVIWSDSSQFKAESIILVLDTAGIDSIKMFDKAMIINSSDEKYFNQIRGKTIFTILNDNSPEKMLVDGNAQSIYFAQDESGNYIGASKTECSNMILTFGKKAVKRIKCEKQTDSFMKPMTDINDTEFKLKDFEWLLANKPTSLDHILLKNIKKQLIKPSLD